MYYKIYDLDFATKKIIETVPIKIDVNSFKDYLKKFWDFYWLDFEDVEIDVHFDANIIIIAKNEEGWLWSKMEIYGLTPKTYQEIQEFINKQKKSA